MIRSTVRAGAGSLAAFWLSRREAVLNWLAFGLLLAAWNAGDDEGAGVRKNRPEALLAYSYVSVRAAQRAAAPSSRGDELLGKVIQPSSYCHAGDF